jgi:hypothetical protein
VPEDPFALLRDTDAACVETRIRYAVIGAVARNAWAAPRATADLDIAAIVPDPPACQRLIAALATRGIVVRRLTAGEDEVPDLLRVERATGIVRRLDILPAKTPFEIEAVTQAVSADLGGPTRVVRPEHLIVYKLIAGRPQDLEDIVEVIRTRALDHSPIDDELVRRWATVWHVVERLDDAVRRSRE